jgi:hypothetical protein
MAVAFALLFFAGNIYYTLHTLICMAVIVLFHMFNRGRFWLPIRRLAVGGVFAFGLTALQFMPVWAVRDYIGGHPGDSLLTSRYDLGQALANFTFSWPGFLIFEDPYYHMIADVDYAYIGPTALLLIAAGVTLLMTPQRQHISDRIAWIALTLAVLMVIWGAGQTPILQYLYANIPRLAEFRFVGRAHAIAALWLLVLVGLSVDALWNAVRIPGQRRRLIRAMGVGGLAWLLVFIYSLQHDSGRAALVFYNYRLKEALDNYRYTTFNEAALGLFALVFVALVAELVLRVVISLRPDKPRPSSGMYGKSILQLLLLGVTFLALADVMQVNSGLYIFNRQIADFSTLYPYIRAADTIAPFPAINEPHSPFAFSAYESEIRNWGLDEGWTPTTPPSIISIEEGELQEIPRWALVWSGSGGGLNAKQYVDSFGYEERSCTSTEIEFYLSERCNLHAPGAAVLYEQPDVLPYTFVVESERLLTEPETVRRDTVIAADVVSHLQDTITVRASTPTSEPDTYLVVQETHFPGWQASVDGSPVETVSVGRFIGIKTLPGEHTYTLQFVPPGLAIGVVVFLATLAGIAFYLRNGVSQGNDGELPILPIDTVEKEHRYNQE